MSKVLYTYSFEIKSNQPAGIPHINPAFVFLCQG